MLITEIMCDFFLLFECSPVQLCLNFQFCRFGWVFQNILAVALSLFSLSQFRLHAFKYVALILAGLFVYDVFMVFLSGYLTGVKF